MKDKKKYLQGYLLYQKRINRLYEMIEQDPKNKRNYKQQIKQCKAHRREIEAKIAAVDGGLLSEILFLKYTCDKSLWEISYIINYSTRQTERLHIKALEEFKL